MRKRERERERGGGAKMGRNRLMKSVQQLKREIDRFKRDIQTEHERDR